MYTPVMHIFTTQVQTTAKQYECSSAAQLFTLVYYSNGSMEIPFWQCLDIT